MESDNNMSNIQNTRDLLRWKVLNLDVEERSVQEYGMASSMLNDTFFTLLC